MAFFLHLRKLLEVRLQSLFAVLFIVFSCNRNPEHSTKDLSRKIDAQLSNFQLQGDISSNDRAFEILRSESRNDSVYRRQIFEVASNFFQIDSLSKFKDACKIAINRSSEARDTLSLAKGYRYIAEYYKSVQENDSAFQALKSAEKLYYKTEDKLNLGRVLYKKALIQYDVHDVLGAELSITQAYNFLKDLRHDELTFSVLSMIGIISNALEDYPKAIEYHTKALEIVKRGNLDPALNQEESTLNNLGGVYQRMNQHTRAIEKFEAALSKKATLKDNPALQAMLFDNLGYSKLQLGETKEVEELFLKALSIRDSLMLDSFVVVSEIHLSEYYSTVMERQKAMEHAHKALQYAEKTNAKVDLVLALKNLAVMDPENASKYTKEYIELNEVLQQYERKSRDKFAKFELETDQLQIEKDKLAEQNRNLLYFFVGTFMVGTLLFIIRTQRAKNRELLLKQAHQKANEDIYNIMINQQTEIEKSRLREKKRIAQELHDGVLGRLFGARLNLDSLNRSSEEEAVARRSTYLAELKKIEQDIREISHDLNREKIELINNFTSILTKLIEEQKESYPSSVKYNIDSAIDWDKVGNSFKINTYRIIQECLQNINKYANANNINLTIKKLDSNLIINIEDDGVGFDVAAKRKGIGLKNITARANELHGTFTIRSKKGKGTSVIVSLPLI